MKNSKKTDFTVSLQGLNSEEALPYALSAQILELVMKHIVDVTKFPEFGLGGDIPIMIKMGPNHLNVIVGEHENSRLE